MSRATSLQQSLPSLWHVARRFWPQLRRQRRTMISAIIALATAIGLRLVEPWPLKFVFDHVLPIGGPVTDGPLTDADPATMAIFAAVAVALLGILRATAEYVQAVGFAIVGNRVLNEVRNDLFNRLQRLSLAFHARSQTGDLVVRVIGDVNMLRDAVSTALLPLTASALVWVGMAALMFVIQWKLALLALGCLPIFWFLASRLTRRIKEAAREQRKREGALAAAAAESLHGVKMVQALSLEAEFGEEFRQRSAKSLKEGVRAGRLSARLERAADVAYALAAALVLGAGALLVRNGSMTAGDLVVFLTYLRRAFHPLNDFAKYAARLAKAAAAGERVLDVMDREPEIRDLPGAVPAPAFLGRLTFENITFDYGPERPVFADLDLEIPAGTCLAVVGPSGVGKSTLLNLALRLYEPTAGRVLIDGQDVRDFTIASLRAQMSVVLQDHVMFSGTVRECIACGAQNASHAAIVEAARLAGAHEFIEALPRGYDTPMAERGATISHGQRQRLAIARAALRQSPILLLDEPTTGLDEENERIVLAALARLAEDRTTVIVTHDLRLAADADVILYLSAGRVLERGTHAELIQLGGKYAALFALQNGEGEHASLGFAPAAFAG